MASRGIPRITSPGGGGQGPPGPPGPDHFQPKYLVGNIPAGDDPVAYNVNGFMYIPDPGDGSGIAIALTQPNGPGDIGIRPGLYNYSAGVVVAPLAVPANVKIVGSGRGTTIIRARGTGDQGAFMLAAGAELHSLMVENTASANGVGSAALIRCVGAVVLRDLSVALVTNVGNALREGIRFVGSVGGAPPASDMQDVIVSSSTTTLDTPTRLVVLTNEGSLNDNAIVSARLLQLFGGNEASYSDGGSLICKDYIAFNWSDFGARWTGDSGSLRLDEGALFSSGANAAAIGVSIQSSGCVLRSLSVQTSAGAIGIRAIAAPGGVVAEVQIDDCIIDGWDDGIILGDGASSTFDITVADCLVNGRLTAIRLEGPPPGGQESSSCHIINNTISMSQGQAAIVAGIHIKNGLSHKIDGNNVSLFASSPTPTAHGIWLESDPNSPSAKSCIVVENNVSVSNAGYCIDTQGERSVVQSNICQANESLGCIHIQPTAGAGAVVRCTVGNNPCTFNTSGTPGPLPAAIVVEGQLCTVGGNAIFTSAAGPTSGIVFTATSANNTCIGNTSEGTPGTPVANLGTGNEIAHNVGV